MLSSRAAAAPAASSDAPLKLLCRFLQAVAPLFVGQQAASVLTPSQRHAALAACEQGAAYSPEVAALHASLAATNGGGAGSEATAVD